MKQNVVLDELASAGVRLGHKAMFLTELFGKKYVWMRDHEGTFYLQKAGESPTEISIDGQTGKVTTVQ